MKIEVLFLAVLPSIIIAYWIYQKDRFDREPRRVVLTCFLLGALATIPALAVQTIFKDMQLPSSLMSTAVYAFLIIGLSEEVSKFIFLRLYAYPNVAFDEPMDGIVYSVMIGMGFATVENVLYAMSTNDPYTMLISRALTAVPAHAAFGVTMGAYVGLAKFLRHHQSSYLLSGLMFAVGLHGAYDFFLLQAAFEWMSVLALLVLFLSIRFSQRLIKVGLEISPFRHEKYKRKEYLNDNEQDEYSEK